MITSSPMTPHERLQAVFSGVCPDRPAFALWRHFPNEERVAQELADATIEFARMWCPDLIKHTPNGMFAVDDWASRLSGGKPLNVDTINFPYSLNLDVNWRDLPRLDIHEGVLARELESLRLVRQAIGDQVPVYMTLFGPLTLAGKLAGRSVIDDMRDRPDDLHAGLQIITDTMIAFTNAVREAGADGLYFATQYASEQLLSEQDHAVFGEPYDVALLQAWGNAGPVILHLCGADIFFDLCNRYPVQAVCWDHGLSEPSLREAYGLTGRVLVAGMEEREFPTSAHKVFEQASDALAISRGLRHILAPTCVIPAESDDRSLAAVVDAIVDFTESKTERETAAHAIVERCN